MDIVRICGDVNGLAAYILWCGLFTRADLLPRCRTTAEVPECLSHLKRLNDDPLLLLVVADLGVTGHGEVLAQWVAIETIVGHDAAQVGVANEEDTEQIVDFAFVPVGAVVQVAERWDGGGLVSVGLDPQARVVSDGEHVVDNLEALVLGGVVDGGDVGDLGVLGGRVVLEEVEDREDTTWGDVDGELVLPDGEPSGLSDGRVAAPSGAVRTAGCTWADTT